jgi:hypothetical protein
MFVAMRLSGWAVLRGAAVPAILLAVLAAPGSFVQAATLADAFAAAGPGAGYDTLVVLDPAVIYTGGLTVPAGEHCLVSLGARVDLQSGSVVVEPGACLDVYGCSFARGNIALDYGSGARGEVIHCNFYNNYIGVKFWDGAAVTLINDTFTANTHYGVYRYEYHGGSYITHCDAWGNTDGDYIEFCPG